MKKIVLVVTLSACVALSATSIEKDCNKGDFASCTLAGKMYEFGIGAKKDFAKAAQFYKKACDGKDYEACSNLGTLYSERQRKGVKQDSKKAIKLYTKACDGGYAAGCSNLGVMYSRGQGVEKDFVKAAAYFRRACDAGYWNGCGRFGAVRYAAFDDKQKAVECFKKACELGKNSDEIGGILEGESEQPWQHWCDIYDALR